MKTGDYKVYKHTFPNGKVYIGITCQEVSRRWRSDGSGYKQHTVLQYAIKKYGWENVKHEILFIGLSKEQAEEKEIELISFYKSTDTKFGYNRTNGGGGQGRIISLETRKKLSESHRGKALSEEHKEKICISNTGKKMSLEQRKKLSKSLTGKKLPDEVKEKIRIKLSKPVIQFDLQGREIMRFPSSISASKRTGILHIHECCKGTRKTAGGFIWKYE